MIEQQTAGQKRQSEQTVGDFFDAHFTNYNFADSSLIIVPGTGDNGGEMLTDWGDFIVDRFDQKRRIVTKYPMTVWPVAGGLRGWREKRYDKSKAEAVDRTYEALCAVGSAVLLGYSQGADAAWEAAVRAVAQGKIDPKDLQVILWGHPQRPDGLKDVLSRKHRITSRLLGSKAIGATMNGPWDIQNHPDINVISLAIEHDPITSFPEVWPNPMRAARSSWAGYLEIHGGAGHESAANVADLSVAKVERVLGTKAVFLDAAAMDPIEQRRMRLQGERGLSLAPEALSA